MEVSTAFAPLAPPAPDFYRDLRFPKVFEAAAIGIALCHFDGRILEGNSALARLLGYEQLELAGLDPWKFYEGDSAAASRLPDLLHGARDSFAVEKHCRRKDASEFWGRLTVSLARNAQHDPAFLIVLLEDATERTRLEQQLRQAEKMEIIGRLTGGIAHDFNNLLTGFLLYCDLLLSKLDSADPLRRHVEEIRQAGEQGSALTQQLLTFARKQEPNPRPVPLNLVVSSTENLLRRLIGEHIELIIALDPAAGAVFADPAQLRQILLNLALNARDALRPGGKIRLQTRAAEFPANAEASTPRPAVSLVVEDNGCGMDPETRAHLFEPFFTTKCPGEGTGMGLATVHRIVTEAGGQIKVSTEPAHGTRIEVFFPTYETVPEPVPSEPNLLSQSTRPPRVREVASFPASRSSSSNAGDPVTVDPRILQPADGPITRSPDVQLSQSASLNGDQP
jgi:PAS domain S-box-containing protein